MFLLLTIIALYILANRCRCGHPGLEALRGWSYAHRGLHSPVIPENSMAAFRAALEKGYGIELDLHLMADGELAVIHDASLKRTAGADIHIEDLTAQDLKNYPLEGTEECIPTFRQLLDLYAGKAPLIVELKPERGNHAALCARAAQMLESYEGPYCIESFDPRCVLWFKNNKPQVIRGQLSENFVRSDSKMSFWLRLALTHQLMNFGTVPDFVAYKFADRKGISPQLCRVLWKAQGVTWTLKTREDYNIAVKEGWLPIFEGFEP